MDLGRQNNDSNSNSFIFQNGQQANSLKDLIIILQNTEKNIFLFHANKTKNDFYEWIKHSLKNPSLASKIKKLNQIDLVNALISYTIEENLTDKNKVSTNENIATNDFSKWIKESLDEPELAKEVQNLDNPSMIKRLINHIKKENINEKPKVKNKDIHPYTNNNDKPTDVDQELKNALKLQEEQRKNHDPKEIILADAISNKEEIVNIKNDFSFLSNNYNTENEETNNSYNKLNKNTINNIDVIEMNAKHSDKVHSFTNDDDIILLLRNEIKNLKNRNDELSSKNTKLTTTLSAYDEKLLKIKNVSINETETDLTQINNEKNKIKLRTDELNNLKFELEEKEVQINKTRDEFLESIKNIIEEEKRVLEKSKKVELLEKSLIEREEQIIEREEYLNNQSYAIKDKIKIYDKEIHELKKEIKKLL